MNPNKVFRRLNITGKLAIAFLFLAGFPLVAVVTVGAIGAIRHLESSVRLTARHDLKLARVQTARSLREVEQHLAFLSESGLASLLTSESAVEGLEELTLRYLRSNPSALFRVRVIDAAGNVRSSLGEGMADSDDGSGGMLYAWFGSPLPPNSVAFLPVELRGPVEGTEAFLPAVAILRTVHGEDGTYRGVVVGEADAATLFGTVEDATPGLEGITGLVDDSGYFLFHSDIKRDWTSLLADREAVSLAGDVGDELAAGIMAVESDGFGETVEGDFVAFANLSLEGYELGKLVLYRKIPGSAIMAPVRSYLSLFGLTSMLLLPLVLGVSLAAARQFTGPIVKLQEAAAAVTGGKEFAELRIETNDELEDLAGDFAVMAQKVKAHREELERRLEKGNKALEDTRAQLAEIVEGSADGIVVLDSGGRIALWNRTSERLLGYSESGVLGRDAREVLRHPSGKNAEEDALLSRAVARDESVVNYRTARLARDGTTIPISLTQSIIKDATGEMVGTSLILRDDRQQSKLDEQMRRSERLAAASLMAAGLAHELNNPLAVMGNRIELMQRDLADSGDERLKEDLEVLRAHLGRIGSVTSDLLRFARDEDGAVGPVDVNPLVERVARLMERLFVARDIHLEIQTKPEIPTAFSSEAALETVLVNLLINAQQATPPGGRVVVETRRNSGDGYVEIEVRDTGPGVPADIRSQIFEPFFTTKTDRGGTGLGLAVCRAATERLGGRIGTNGAIAAGAAFVVAFPPHQRETDD